MENQINIATLDEYSVEVAESIATGFYTVNKKMTGEQVLKLTNIEQINFFILYFLFNEWENEIENLKSPYFDFDNNEVKDALIKFMNIVSKHISIEKEDAFVLIQKSVFFTVLLAAQPSDFFKHLFGKSCEFSTFKSLLKFIKTYKNQFESFIENNSESHTISIDHFIIKANKELFFSLLSQLKEIKDIPSNLIESRKTESASSENIEPKIHIFQEENTTTSNEQHQTSTDDPHSNQLNTTLQIKSKTETLADKLGKIKLIRNHISINQRFLFIKALFNENESDFSETINRLDSFSDLDNCLEYVHSLTQQYNWDIESEEFLELMHLIQKKF